MAKIRSELSPRHVPAVVEECGAGIPKTSVQRQVTDVQSQMTDIQGQLTAPACDVRSETNTVSRQITDLTELLNVHNNTIIL
ncbi:hypothetical protein E5D57_003361 [Metarhizium anisopliae]|nr:hypothetical protein E5D57_003361 [Metarhizium anisopliae]